jgi:ribonuclease HII
MATNTIKYIIGIDEAGRGPLAGPVSVGVVLVPVNLDWKHIPQVADSKALSEKKRDMVYQNAKTSSEELGIVTSVVFRSAHDIDQRGIAIVIKEAIAEGLEEVIKKAKVEVKECQVLLDGSLKAPSQYRQETIIKGDAKEPVIGLASIYAKVERDKYMKKIAQKKAYFAYNLAIHKGYGTKAHREAIAEYGLSKEHRVSFCKNIKIS